MAGDLELELKATDEQFTEKGRMVGEAALASLTDVLEDAVEFYNAMDRDPLAHRVRAALEIYVSSLTGALSGSTDVLPGWVVMSLARVAERRWKKLAATDA